MRVIINKQTDDPVALEILYLKVLFRESILKIGRFLEIFSLNPSQETVVFPSILAEEKSDSTKDIAQIGIVEAEADKEKRLGDEITLERGGKQMSGGLIGFIVILGNNGLVGLRNIAVHLVNDGITARDGRRKVVHRDLNVRRFPRRSEGILNENVVVGGPIGLDGELGKEPVVLCGLGSAGKFIDESLVDPVASTAFIDVELGDCDQIVLLIYVKSDIAGDILEQFVPVHQAGWNRQACAGKDGGVLIMQRLNVGIDEGLDGVTRHIVLLSCCVGGEPTVAQ